MEDGHADLSSRVYVVLYDNDQLLRELARELPCDTPYIGDVEQYFNRLDAQYSGDVEVPNQGNSFTFRRTRPVTEILKKLWVVEHRKEMTYRIFEDYERFEDTLFQLEDYRGHYIHQFNVFLLGYYVLNRLLQREDGPIKEIFTRPNRPIFTWMLTSTFHDIGYPI